MPGFPRRFLLLAAAFALPQPVAGGAVAPRQFPGDTTIQRILDQRVVAGGAIGVVVGLLEVDGTTRIFEAGSAGDGVPPLGARSVFQIGSISKVFTGALLADMIVRGEVSANDPVEAYLPHGFRSPVPGGGRVTLADLATHHSGLPYVPDDLPVGTLSDPYADYTKEALHAFLARFEPPARKERGFQYSNVGVGLLGRLLADRLGMTWEEAVRERVLEPLGMHMTRVEPDDRMRAHATRGHDLGGVPVPDWDFGVLAAAGGLHSNAEDLLRFLAANLTPAGSDLQRALRMAHHPRARIDRERTVGLTWMIRADGGRRTVWHGGGTSGYRTFLGFDPDRAVGVVVLANSGPGVEDLGFHLLNPSEPLRPPRLPPFSDRAEGPSTKTRLDRFVGEYFVVPGAPMRVALERGRLWVDLPGRSPLPAYADGRGGFFLRSAPIELSFETDGSGAVTMAVVRQGSETLRARRLGSTGVSRVSNRR